MPRKGRCGTPGESAESTSRPTAESPGTQALKINEDTGVTDLEFDPRNPDVLFAAAYQRRRTVWSFLAGGPNSGLYKSTDAGENWRKLEKGLPKGDMGKIGIAVSPVDPDYVYATIEATEKEKGFYRSTDSGESWEKRNSYVSGGTGPHYYQEIYASPFDRDRVYQMDVWMQWTEDGGKTFSRLGEDDKHSDNHALAFDPNDPEHLLAGCDGGLYETFDHAKNWRFVANMPITQFYKLSLDNDFPFYNMVGGTQDNNTQLGPSRTPNQSGVRNQDWIVTLGGDGYSCQIDPKDPNIVYSEWQVGSLARFDKATGQRVDIKPQPAAGDPPERWNWDAPILISPHSHTRLYYGSQRIWRSDDRGDSWKPISGDLTRNENRYQLQVAGRVWSVDAIFDHMAMSLYNTTSSISESPLVEGLIYVGTDDGLIQVSEDGGGNWRRLEALPGVPDRFFVNEIKASVTDPDTVFVAVDSHKTGDYRPYLFKSTDRGRTWTSIAGDLPERQLVWSIEQDSVKPELLFLGAESGLYFTVDGGGHWILLKGGVPTISFRDIEIQRRDNDLVGASFGRGFYILDDYTPLREVSESSLKEGTTLLSVRKALRYIPSDPLGAEGGDGKAYQGSAYFTAPNPPFGAVFTYYLAEGLKSDKEKRREKEKEIRKEGGDVPFPGWDALKQEMREEEPQVILAVRGSDGKVIRRVKGSAGKGFHRVAWDLRYPALDPIRLDDSGFVPPWMRDRSGPLVGPGTYTVSLSSLVNGKETELGQSQSFEVVALGGSTLPEQNPTEVLTFERRTAELLRKAGGAQRRLSELEKELKYMHEAALRVADAAPLLDRIRRLQLQAADLNEQLSGDEARQKLEEATVPGILGRLRPVLGADLDTTYGPTETHRKNVDIAEKEWKQFEPAMSQFESDIQSLEKDMEEAKAPYTPR